MRGYTLKSFKLKSILNQKPLRYTEQNSKTGRTSYATHYRKTRD